MTEYEAVRDGGAGLIDLSTLRGRIRVSGSEATMFLNGLITNDVKNLAQNRWMPAVFPTVQGRLIGAVRVIRGSGPEFLIDTETTSHDAVLKTVSRFTLAGDFKVSDVTKETALLTVQGERAAEVVEKVFATPVSGLPSNGVVETDVTIIRASHTGENGFDLFIDSSRKAELQQALEAAGAQPIGEDTFEILRVEAGIARFGQDMDETNVVPETNLDDAVSFTKGCYVGQEIVERIHSRGNVHRMFTGFVLQGAKPEAGAKVVVDGKEVGEITSSAVLPGTNEQFTVALGYIRREHGAAGKEVMIGNVRANVSNLPFSNIFSE